MATPTAEPTSTGSNLPGLPRQRRPKRERQSPSPECQYLRLADFPVFYQISVSTAYRLAGRKKLPFIRVPGTTVMLFPRARVEQVIRSWERNGREQRR